MRRLDFKQLNGSQRFQYEKFMESNSTNIMCYDQLENVLGVATYDSGNINIDNSYRPRIAMTSLPRYNSHVVFYPGNAYSLETFCKLDGEDCIVIKNFK